MGGKESSRGYLYQAVASSLEALCEDGWDRIYIEYDSENDKVDIALKQDDVIFKSIQVKSTINTFNKKSCAGVLNDTIINIIYRQVRGWFKFESLSLRQKPGIERFQVFSCPTKSAHLYINGS